MCGICCCPPNRSWSSTPAPCRGKCPAPRHSSILRGTFPTRSAGLWSSRLNTSSRAHPDQEVLARFPETVTVSALTTAVEYRFAPGESGDGATLNIPLLALPTLTRAAVDAAIPGLVEPRLVALLRSLPKDARRRLIPIADTAKSFLFFMGTPSTDRTQLTNWLREVRGIPAELLRFELAQVPVHLTPRLAVIEDGKELASGTDIADLRRRCAARARDELNLRRAPDAPCTVAQVRAR